MAIFCSHGHVVLCLFYRADSVGLVIFSLLLVDDRQCIAFYYENPVCQDTAYIDTVCLANLSRIPVFLDSAGKI